MQAEEAALESGVESSVPASPDAQTSRASVGPSSPGAPEEAVEEGGSGAPDALAGPPPAADGSLPGPPPTTDESSIASAYSGAVTTVAGEASAHAASGVGANPSAGSDILGGATADALQVEGGDAAPAEAAAVADGTGASATALAAAAAAAISEGGAAGRGAEDGSSGGPSASGAAAVGPGAEHFAALYTEPGAASGPHRTRASSPGGAGHRASAPGGSRSGSPHDGRTTDGGSARPRSREQVPPALSLMVGSAAHAAAKPPTPPSAAARASVATPPSSSRPQSREQFDGAVVGHSPMAGGPRVLPAETLDMYDMLGHSGPGQLPPPALPPPPPQAAPAPAPAPASHGDRATSAGSGGAAGRSAASPAHGGPLVMPFAERQRAQGGGTDGRSGTPQGPATGRRPGSHGSVRLGSASKSPPPGSPAAGTTGLESPRASQPSRGSTSPAPPAPPTAQTPPPPTGQTPPPSTRAVTTDGSANGGAAGGTSSTPPSQRPTGSGDRSGKPRSGHAAGGGAAAVKAAAAAAAAAVRAAGGASVAAMTLHDQQLQHALIFGDAIRITGVSRSGVTRSGQQGGGLAGLPGRRGRRTQGRSASAAASAAATAAYFAELEAEVAAGTAAGKALLPSGLARRLKAARMTATGPPPFQRRREPPQQQSPAGVKLDGFMLLEAADEEMPEAVQTALLESHAISAVESADLAYFVSLRDLDVSDNRLPDLACLAPLQALVRLRAASCGLGTLGRWQDGAAVAAGGGGGGGDAGEGSMERPTATGDGTTGTATGSGSAATAASTAGSAATSTAAAAVAAARKTSHSHSGSRATGTGAGAPPAAADAAAAVAAADTGHGPGADPAAAAPESSESLLLPPLPLVPNPFQRLEILDLSFNALPPHMVLLPGCPLAALPRLAELDLSSNRLRHLPAPADIRAAAAAVAAEAVGAEAESAGAVRGSTGSGWGTGTGAGCVAFPALRRLRLADNGLKGSALASLAALAPPVLAHLDLSHNAIAEAPHPANLLTAATLHSQADGAPAGQPGPGAPSHQHAAGSRQPSQEGWMQPLAGVLPALELLDLSFNRVASEAAVAALTQLPALRRLLLAGNPLVINLQRPHAGPVSISPKIDLSHESGPARPRVAASLTARFARIAEAPPKQQASNLAAAAAAAITASAAPERVTEAFDRMDATIEQWRLNTVMEEDEEEEDEEDDGEEAPEDRTFLTGIGIQERRRRAGRPGSAAQGSEEGGDAAAGPELHREASPEPAASEAPASQLGGEESAEQPLWESITDPTERLAVALGLDPLTLPMHTGALTTDSAGAIAALRFALAHPLVEADDGLAPHPRYAAATTATQLKRKPRRTAAPPRLAPMEPAAAAAAAAGAQRSSPRAAKIQSVEAMLEGMKGKLAALEASLAAQLAAAPAAPAPEAVRNAVRASKGRYGVSRGGRGATGSDTDSETVDDGASTGSGLPDDVIDQIERESSSEAEEDLEAEETPLDPMQGLVLLADHVVLEEATANSSDPTATSNAARESRSRSVSPSVTRGHGTPLSSRPSVAMAPSPQQQAPPSALRPAGSPQRSRKSLVTAGSSGQAPLPSVTLPGSAASALGYAS